jgi:peptide/nickel transport system ATP-binding protein
MAETGNTTVPAQRAPAPEPGEVLVQARDLTRDFGRAAGAVRAVDGVNFEIREREIVTVVGESGSGKSTLARLVLRLLDATSGTLHFAGRDVTALKGPERNQYWTEVQAVFQDPFASFNQFFTVKGLLERSGRLLGRSAGTELRERMEEALAHVGMDPDAVLGRFPHELSGGQRQRVMIARALMMRPRLLVADEATSMLDASLRANILNVLSGLRRDLGMTVLFITHDIGQAAYVSDRVLVMRNGEMVEQGPTEEVIFDPQHEYTRALLGDVPRLHENILD